MGALRTKKYMKTVKNIENLKLKDIVTAFMPKQKIEILLENLNKRGFDENNVAIFTDSEAGKIVDITKHSMSIMTRIQRIFEGIIGGGPTEFMRDVKRMRKDQYLILVDVKSETEKDEVFAAFRSVKAKRVKYFTKFYVEHGTLESDHRQMAAAL